MMRPLPSRYRLAVVAAAATTLDAFMRPHLEAAAAVYSTTAICGGDRTTVSGLLPPGVYFRHVPIERKISLLRDFFALCKLIFLFHRERYTLVHSITPKAGLLAMLAAFLCNVPLRVHVFTGQVWVTRTGLARYFLKSLDRLIAVLASHVLADSASQRQFLIEQGVVSSERIDVLAEGSICGVDSKRFRPDSGVRSRLHSALQLPDGAVVVLFLGRLTRDKGVMDLANAFVQSLEGNHPLYLLIVGPDEDDLTADLRQVFAPCADKVRFVGMTDRPEDYMAAADILCLPSYREGFGAVIIEAAAAGVPAVASRIYGLTDAVEDGVTGLLHDPGDVEGLRAKLQMLASDAVLRARMGKTARERALTKFSSSRVVAAQMAFYASLFGSLHSRATDTGR
jgi:glycosyltransferase involved in cell wall biosynthesis